MRDSDRYKISVRAPRDYLAGFGTSGSLLAGAAVLFLLASAIVAFRGWPQISAGSAHSYLAAPPVPVASRTARRLAVALRARRLLLAARGSSALHARGAAARRTAPASGVVRGVTATMRAPGSGASAGPAVSPGGGRRRQPRSGSGSAAPNSCGGSCNSGSRNVIVHVTNNLARTVQTVGTTVGDQITGVGQAAAAPVSSVSPTAGSATSNVVTTAGGVVSGTATTAANVISSTGGALGGGH